MGLLMMTAASAQDAKKTSAEPPSEVPESAKAELMKAIRERAEKLRSDTVDTAGKKYRDAAAELKAATDGKVIGSQGKTLPPAKGRPTYTFPTAEARAAKVKELEKKLAEVDPVSLAATNPAGYAPDLGVFEPGRAGRLVMTGVDVVEVIDKTSAVVTVRQLVAGAKAEVRKVDVLVSGIDTSKMADGMQSSLKAVYYITGSKKVGGRTLMRLVPVTLSAEDTATLTGEKKPAEKK